jgi:hypothetical protein
VANCLLDEFENVNNNIKTKNQKVMKKTVLTILVILTSVVIFSFTTRNENEGEIKITVTADKQT